MQANIRLRRADEPIRRATDRRCYICNPWLEHPGNVERVAGSLRQLPRCSQCGAIACFHSIPDAQLVQQS